MPFQQAIKSALVKFGLMEKNGSFTKRSYLFLLLGGNCYVFILLFSFLLGHFGETIIALVIFLLGVVLTMKFVSLQRRVTELSTKKK